MQNFWTNKNVLIVSSLITLFLVFLFSLGSNLCYSSSVCREFSESKIVDIFNSDYLLTLFVLPPVLLFSLITYKMRDEVFHAWWNFARWMVPIIILATIIIQFIPSNGGFFNMDGLIYLLILTPLYAIFILVSLIKITLAYRILKRGEGEVANLKLKKLNKLGLVWAFGLIALVAIYFLTGIEY